MILTRLLLSGDYFFIQRFYEEGGLRYCMSSLYFIMAADDVVQRNEKGAKRKVALVNLAWDTYKCAGG